MDGTNIADYKLDRGILKEIIVEVLENLSAENFTIQLPVLVQVIRMSPIDDEWNSYILSDGEFVMSRCAFLSKQAIPECYSVLKIKKVSKLPMDMRTEMKDYFPYRLGEIEFDTEVSGKQIGFSLYPDNKNIDIKELVKRKEEIGLANLVKRFESRSPSEIMMNHMWENRSPKFCDVNFTFEDVKSVKVFAHGSVLIAISDVFKANFDNEAFIDNKSVHIVDSSLYSFTKLLEFIYTGKVQFTTWELTFDLLYLSKKYLISPLEELCQRVLFQFCDHDSENLLKVFELNQKVNDDTIQNYVENDLCSEIREAVNSEYFLNCDFSTIEWILSLNSLAIDEWSLLCSLYKWACHNEVNAFCQRLEDDTSETSDCLHTLLECIRYENIDGHSLQRFFKLHKLPELVDVSELKLSVFESLLKDESYFNDVEVGSKCYSKFRSGSSVFVEIEVGDSQETQMKNIHLSNNGPVVGFKVKIEKNEEHSLDIFPSLRILHGTGEEEGNECWIEVRALQSKSRIVTSYEDVSYVQRYGDIRQGQWKQFKLHLKDCQDYLFGKIEDLGAENNEDFKKANLICLEIHFE